MKCPHCGGSGHIKDTTKAILQYNGVTLSLQEGKLLGWLFTSSSEAPLSTQTLFNILCPSGLSRCDSYVGIYITKLRRKLEGSDLEIINIFGRGYYIKRKEQA